MKKLILTDVDGVLLDWLGGFRIHMELLGHKTSSELPTTWELDSWINLPRDHIKDHILSFNRSEKFKDLTVMHDALKVLPKLAKDHNFVAITSCASDPVTVAMRKLNLEQLGVPFKDVHCLDLGKSKLELLKMYPNSIWVEDNAEGAEAGASVGHRSFLIKRPYNENHQSKTVIHVDSWFDILKAIKE